MSRNSIERYNPINEFSFRIFKSSSAIIGLDLLRFLSGDEKISAGVCLAGRHRVTEPDTRDLMRFGEIFRIRICTPAFGVTVRVFVFTGVSSVGELPLRSRPMTFRSTTLAVYLSRQNRHSPPTQRRHTETTFRLLRIIREDRRVEMLRPLNRFNDEESVYRAFVIYLGILVEFS